MGGDLEDDVRIRERWVETESQSDVVQGTGTSHANGFGIWKMMSCSVNDEGEPDHGVTSCKGLEQVTQKAVHRIVSCTRGGERGIFYIGCK